MADRTDDKAAISEDMLIGVSGGLNTEAVNKAILEALRTNPGIPEEVGRMIAQFVSGNNYKAARSLIDKLKKNIPALEKILEMFPR